MDKPIPEIQRWSMAKGSDGKRWSVYMDHDPCGEWVKWVDVQQHFFAAALTAAQQQGQGWGEVEPDGYTSYGEFRWACDCDERQRREWTPVYLAPPSAPVGVKGFDEWFDEYTKNNYTDEMLALAAWKQALAQQPAAVDEARWQPIATMPTDDTIVLAKTGDGRVMIYRGSILARNLLGPTPEHLKFPAVKWMQIPGDVE